MYITVHRTEDNSPSIIVVMSRKRKVTELGLSIINTSAESLRPKDVKSYYLMKSEPDEFSIDALCTLPNCTSGWEGVRNYQARNNLSLMKVGDLAFFYHSNAKSETGIVGIVQIVREAYIDRTATDSSHKYFDSRASKNNTWVSVDVKLVEKFSRPLLVPDLKKESARSDSTLSNMQLIKNTRLSVQKVSPEEWQCVLDMIKS